MLRNVAGTVRSASVVLLLSSGKESSTSMNSWRISSESSRWPGGTKKSSGRMPRSSRVSPKRRCNPSRSADFPEPLRPTRAVIPGSSVTSIGCGLAALSASGSLHPKHRNRHSCMDTIFMFSRVVKITTVSVMTRTTILAPFVTSGFCAASPKAVGLLSTHLAIPHQPKPDSKTTEDCCAASATTHIKNK